MAFSNLLAFDAQVYTKSSFCADHGVRRFDNGNKGERGYEEGLNNIS